MPAPIPSIAGQRFGRLEAVREVEQSPHGARRWLCRCECGTEKVILQDQLRQGRTLSCGCFHREVSRVTPLTHGGTGSPEYRVWRNMINRCHLPTASSYARYGGRGIGVADIWRGPKGFAQFLADVGARPSPTHSIDRYPNTNGNYEPGNVRWATDAEQRRNKRNTLRVRWQDQELPLVDLTARLGLSYFATRSRLCRGWSLEDALTRPPGYRRSA